MEMLLKMSRFGKAIVVFAILIFILPLIAAPPCQAQVTTYGNVGAGPLMVHGETTRLCVTGGVDVPLLKRDSGNTLVFSRTNYFHIDMGDSSDVNAIREWFWGYRYFPLIGIELHGGFGGGYLMNFGEPDKAGIGVDFGADIYKDFTISAQVLYQPADKGGDPTLFQVVVDLTP